MEIGGRKTNRDAAVASPRRADEPPDLERDQGYRKPGFKRYFQGKLTGFGTGTKGAIQDASEVSDSGYWVEGRDQLREKNSRGITGLEGVSGSPRQPPGWVGWFTRTQHIAYICSGPWLMLVKGYEVQSAKGKGTWGAVPRKPGTSVPESSPRGVSWNVFDSSSNESWHYL